MEIEERRRKACEGEDEDAMFGAFVVKCVEEGGRTCINGLPFVPPSTRMLGRFQYLKNLQHQNLCRYLELFRCKLAKSMVIVVIEHFGKDLDDLLVAKSIEPAEMFSIIEQVCIGIDYLHSRNYVHGNCSMANVLISNQWSTEKEKIAHEKLDIRLSGYALPYLTDKGKDALSSGSCSVYSLPPEILLTGTSVFKASRKADIWAIGMIALQFYLNLSFKSIWSETQFTSVIQKVCNLSKGSSKEKISPFDKSALQGLNEAIEVMELTTRTTPNQEFEKLIEDCLMINPAKRPTIHEVRERLEKMTSAIEKVHQSEDEDFGLDDVTEMIEKTRLEIEQPGKYILSRLTIEDAFYLWKQCGATCENILIQSDIINLRMSSKSVPALACVAFSLFGNEEDRNYDFENVMFSLPFKQLIEKVKAVSVEDLLFQLHRGSNNAILPDGFTVIVREKDLNYQISRILLFRRILSSLAHGDMKEKLRKAATIDIPPGVRSEVWSSLLDVCTIHKSWFNEFDTLAPHASDRQLDVDIPRCHQYEDMMTSPAAHAALRRILKGWLLKNPQYVYWQGCDSLAAPFLLQNFDEPEVALSCLDSFINRYLFDFFLQDNSHVIQEYLAVFNHLLAYLDAQLYSHLSELGFFPELYAIPWFLTCFAHVLPMHQVLHIWDMILVHDTTFPLMVGLAVMKQLRPRLIDSSFNDAILLFSDLPDLAVDKVMDTSLQYYKIVPPSCAFRIHTGSWKFPHTEGPYTLNHELVHYSVAELKGMDCPRMSFAELAYRVMRNLIVVIDIRNNAEYSRGCVQRAINYPDIDDDSLISIAEALTTAREMNHPICIMWGKDFESAIKFSSKLVKLGINGVCISDVGFETVREKRALIIIPFQ